ncbi:MAG: stage II sporulation protein M [Planctomycetes bacterium]|nr:stage II sporulation protein M [Planctomycetota bacterium]
MEEAPATTHDGPSPGASPTPRRRLGGLASFGIALALFLAGLVGGWPFTTDAPQDAAKRDRVLGNIHERLAQPAWDQLRHILRNNLLAYASLVAGAVTAGVLTSIELLVLGAWVTVATLRDPSSQLLPPALLAALLVPHGIFEMAAFLIGAGAGLRGGGLFYDYLMSGTLPSQAELSPVRRQAVAGALLCVAAGFVEVFGTPIFIRHFLP